MVAYNNGHLLSIGILELYSSRHMNYKKYSYIPCILLATNFSNHF